MFGRVFITGDAKHLLVRRVPSPMSDMIWKDIPGFADYEVSEYGHVRHGARMLKPSRENGIGRKKFHISKGARSYSFYAHQLVAIAFVGRKPFKDAEVCHNDGFEHNNHYSNLRWDSHASNMADLVKHKVQRRVHAGLHVPQGKLLVVAANELLHARRPKAARPR